MGNRVVSKRRLPSEKFKSKFIEKEIYISGNTVCCECDCKILPLKRQCRQSDLLPFSIDKISLAISLDFIADESLIPKMQSCHDWYTLRKYSGYLFVDIHREYIPLNKPIYETINRTITFIIEKQPEAFIVPYRRESISVLNNEGEVITQEKVRIFDATEPIYEVLLRNFNITSIEFAFDSSIHIPEGLEFKGMHRFINSYYSNDYCIYKDGHKRESFAIIYKKDVQLREIKGMHCVEDHSRFELTFDKLHSLKTSGVQTLLKGPYCPLELFERLLPYTLKKMKKVGMDMNEVISLFSDNPLLNVIFSKL